MQTADTFDAFDLILRRSMLLLNGANSLFDVETNSQAILTCNRNKNSFRTYRIRYVHCLLLAELSKEIKKEGGEMCSHPRSVTCSPSVCLPSRRLAFRDSKVLGCEGAFARSWQWEARRRRLPNELNLITLLSLGCCVCIVVPSISSTPAPLKATRANESERKQKANERSARQTSQENEKRERTVRRTSVNESANTLTRFALRAPGFSLSPLAVPSAVPFSRRVVVDVVQAAFSPSLSLRWDEPKRNERKIK